MSVKPGKKLKIIWNVVKELGDLNSYGVQFKITAKPMFTYEQLAWQATKQKNNCKSYRNFTETYPRSDYKSEAEAQIALLCPKIAKAEAGSFANYTETVGGVSLRS